jgi:hypothetical protein
LLEAAVLGRLATLARRGRILAVLRTLGRIDRRHGFLVASRAADAIAWYARSRAILREQQPGAVLVSSDSNPEEVAFVAAARAQRIPQIFVAHAYPTPLSPPLDFSLSILEGEAAVRARCRRGAIKGQILLAGVEGDSAPMDPHRFERANPSIGIFTPKGVSWPTLAAVIADCRQHFRPRQILIRWHPSMLEAPRLSDAVADRSGIVESPRGAALQDVARQCDWVIGDENSNVHLPVLKLGIPTIGVKSLGLYPPSRADMYGFIADRIVFGPVTAVRDVDPNAVLAFFADDWESRFRQYDAAYLRSEDAIASEVRRAVASLIDGQPGRSGAGEGVR